MRRRASMVLRQRSASARVDLIRARPGKGSGEMLGRQHARSAGKRDHVELRVCGDRLVAHGRRFQRLHRHSRRCLTFVCIAGDGRRKCWVTTATAGSETGQRPTSAVPVTVTGLTGLTPTPCLAITAGGSTRARSWPVRLRSSAGVAIPWGSWATVQRRPSQRHLLPVAGSPPISGWRSTRARAVYSYLHVGVERRHQVLGHECLWTFRERDEQQRREHASHRGYRPEPTAISAGADHSSPWYRAVSSSAGETIDGDSLGNLSTVASSMPVIVSGFRGAVPAVAVTARRRRSAPATPDHARS